MKTLRNFSGTSSHSHSDETVRVVLDLPRSLVTRIDALGAKNAPRRPSMLDWSATLSGQKAFRVASNHADKWSEEEVAKYVREQYLRDVGVPSMGRPKLAVWRTKFLIEAAEAYLAPRSTD